MKSAVEEIAYAQEVGRSKARELSPPLENDSAGGEKIRREAPDHSRPPSGK
jgi:hypothetical protein